MYHWRELPQELFLSRQRFCRNKGFVTTNTYLSRQTRVCRDKTRLLSRQKYACRGKIFVATKLCLLRQICFIKTSVATTKHLSRQQNFSRDKTKYFCCDKYTSVATKDMFCRNKHTFVKHVFVATKMIFVAALANDTEGY